MRAERARVARYEQQGTDDDAAASCAAYRCPSQEPTSHAIPTAPAGSQS